MQVQLHATHQIMINKHSKTSSPPNTQYISFFIKYQIVSNINYIQIM